MAYYDNAPVLPCGTMKPKNPKANYLYESWGMNCSYFVFERDNGKHVLVSSWGILSPESRLKEIGTVYGMRGDQTGRSLGKWICIDVVDAADLGKLPKKSYPLYCFK